ncbi:hypothetical protein [Rickettsiales endosymbiont of Peranema trichophorum]|uniref:hypothetical protein n=1 Tax=Rickettsiales endosymbiont of Peranema trichophorum TaxID=2486577 RepID=UPI001A936F1F|nr:hypothetical protein [Rickettsiales endosymbiont of Peranema trichophorum]
MIFGIVPYALGYQQRVEYKVAKEVYGNDKRGGVTREEEWWSYRGEVWWYSER